MTAVQRSSSSSSSPSNSSTGGDDNRLVYGDGSLGLVFTINLALCSAIVLALIAVTATYRCRQRAERSDRGKERGSTTLTEETDPYHAYADD